MSVLIPSLRAAIAVPQWSKNELWRRARAVPSLDLRFAESKSLVDATTGSNLVTFTRASSGTYTDSQGVIKTAATNEPRFDHNPTTGESLGLLVEESRTNLLTYSNFASGWLTARSEPLQFNQGTAPDGTNTACLWRENTSAGATYLYRSRDFVAGITYTVSVFAKQYNGQSLSLLFSTANGFSSAAPTSFSLEDGTYTTPPSGHTATSTAYPNGWFRFSLTATCQTTTTANWIAFQLGDDYADPAYGIYIWGAQLEAGSFPTSYIPTTTTAVTRAADVCSISGSNYSSWANASAGTTFVEAATSKPLASGTVFADSMTDGTSSNVIITGRFSSPPLQPRIDAAGSVQASLGVLASYTPQNAYKVSLAYAANDFAASATTGTLATDTAGTVPAVDRLNIGSLNGSSGFLGGTIRRLVYWGQRLPNTTLQAITQ